MANPTTSAQAEVPLAAAERAPGLFMWARRDRAGAFTLAVEDPIAPDLFGFPSERLGRDASPLLQRIHPEDRSGVLEAIERSAADLGTFNRRWRYQHPAKGWRWLQVWGQPAREPDGAVLWRGFALDVTDQMEMEGALRASEARLRLLVEHAPAAIAMFDRDMRYLVASRRWLDDFGLAGQALLGRSHYEVFPELPPAWLEAHCQAMGGDTIGAEEDRFVRWDGRAQWVRWEARPWRQADGSIGGIVLFSEEITGRKLAVDALQRSQERFAKAFLRNPMPMAITSLRDGRVVEANDSWCGLVGLAREDTLGQTLETIGAAPDPGAGAMARVALGTSGSLRNLPLRLERRDGQVRHLLFSGEPVELAGEACLVASAQDITEQRRAEQAMAESEVRFRTLFEHSPVALWEEDRSRIARRFAAWRRAGVADARAHLLEHPEELLELAARSRVLAANESALRLMGVAGAADLERALAGQPAGPALAGLREELAALYRGEAGYEAEVDRDNAQGRPLHVQVRLSVLPGHERDLSRVLISLTDLTERRAAEAERQHLERELNHLQRLEGLGRLAGGVAHDMNNVLGVIMAMGSILKARPGAGQEEAKDAEILLQAAARGRDLVRGLRDFGRKQLESATELDLNELVRQEAELLERTLLKRVALVLDLEPGLQPVRGEATSIQNALMNLCLNAADAMPLKGTIVISTRALVDGFVELVVQDDGLGMAPEVAARALEPFFTTKPAGQGTGLGLSQVYGMVRAHGGTLDIQSAPGKGTRVTLGFPRSTRTGPCAEAAASEPLPARRPLDILLVDDEELVRGSILALLELLGHRPQAAGGGLEALGRLQAGLRVDLVILDISMPGLDGVETFGRIRALRPDLPVLFATGLVDERVVAILKDHPDLRILKKPFDVNDLERVLGGWA